MRCVAPHQPQMCACGDHAFRPVGGGLVVLVSASHVAELEYACKVARKSHGYLQVCRFDGKKTITLARSIFQPKGAEQVDHINGDSLDNRSGNLRGCTPQQNAFNRRVQKNSKTKLKGVSVAKSGKFQAAITVSGVRTYLGSFDTAVAAHKAYREASVRFHGEFARYK